MLREEKVIVISGPTASGKTALSLLLAKKLDGEIISADSMQIYKGLDIGTAKASLEEQAGIPHHLYDICEPIERYSVSHFVDDARKTICNIIDRGKCPIVCGGTGQYILALVDGLQFVEEETDLEFREKIRQEIQEKGLLEAHSELKRLDPEAGKRIHPEDEKRIIRFIEVYRKTGLTSSEVYAYSREKGPDFHFEKFVLWPDRARLYHRINERSWQMLEEGMLNELEEILASTPNFIETQAFQAIGYKEIYPHLLGEETREEAYEKLARATRRYAKRQYTLFRKRDDFYKISEPSLDKAFEFICNKLQQ